MSITAKQRRVLAGILAGAFGEVEGQVYSKDVAGNTTSIEIALERKGFVERVASSSLSHRTVAVTEAGAQALREKSDS